MNKDQAKGFLTNLVTKISMPLADHQAALNAINILYGSLIVAPEKKDAPKVPEKKPNKKGK